jgi:hypothetical protein
MVLKISESYKNYAIKFCVGSRNFEKGGPLQKGGMQIEKKICILGVNS